MREIRCAAETDAARLLEIYRYYVENTAITFEYETPSLPEFQARMRAVQLRYPYLVILQNGRIEGYAYAAPFVGRAAYDWACETTIYLAHSAQKCGMGKMLYSALQQSLTRMGILNMYACIAVPSADDVYLTTNSADFHTHFGFRRVGYFQNCGYKFGRWYHMIWMEKSLGSHPAAPAPITPYPQLK